MEHDVIIIGAGQAGLAASYYLKQHNIGHIVLERHRIGDSWERQRWDSFKMNTPNWMTQLPGRVADPATREDFMSNDEFVDYLRSYAREFALPVIEHQQVHSLKKTGDTFEINGTYYAKAVIIAAGKMNALQLPPIAAQIPVFQVHAGDYKNPTQLPSGDVLVVGAGQSGCQIAEELALAGRKVYLASSKVPRAPRRVAGKDIMEWMHLMGIMDTLAGEGRDTQQPQVSEHTVSYQSLHQLGVTILGSMDGVLTFKDNASYNVLYADKFSADFKKAIEQFSGQTCETDTNDTPDPDCNCVSSQQSISGISAIVWAIGFGYDFSWIAPGLLDSAGIYSLGFPWLRKKKSGLVFGVDEDARVITEQIKSFIFGSRER